MGNDRRVILHSSLWDRFKFWFLGGERGVIYPERTEYRTGAVLSFPLWKRVYVRWFWRPKKYKGQKVDGEISEQQI